MRLKRWTITPRLPYVGLVLLITGWMYLHSSVSVIDEDSLSRNSKETDPGTREASTMCIAILTGFPEMPERKQFVFRLAGQLRNIISNSSESTYDLHVFHEGRLNTNPLASFFESLPVNLQVHSVGDRRKRKRRIGRLRANWAKSSKSNKTWKDETRFIRDNQWFFQTRNYRQMFDYLFARDVQRYRYCSILEDDLILSPDALHLLREGEALMDSDGTVFTISIYNDNSYPLYANDPNSFRRVDHFAGLGFVMSGKRYLEEVRPVWSDHQLWDVIVQKIVTKMGYVSIVTEVSRAMHLRDHKCTSRADLISPRHLFESQTMNEVTSTRYNLKDIVQESRYNAFIAGILRNGSAWNISRMRCSTEQTPIWFISTAPVPTTSTEF